ncbi:hypothetical protein HanIR_Chr15g0768751 [Helianthus annuus]|nr:hypothetical protein HanIR_Chr15g0768751 [Helianthus annuus]
MRERVKQIKKERKSVVRMRGKCNLHTYVEYPFIRYVVNVITIILEILEIFQVSTNVNQG